MQEIDTEELGAVVTAEGRRAFRLPVYGDGDFRIEQIVAALRQVEMHVPAADFYVYCPTLFTHVKIHLHDPDYHSRAIAVGAYLHTMHLDTLPYSSVIVSVPFASADQVISACGAIGMMCDPIEQLE